MDVDGRHGAASAGRRRRRAGAHQRAGLRHTRSATRTSSTLLDAGINVITAVNIQHIESLNDAIASTTGVRVRETIPDWVLKRADEVVNVDVSVETLRDAAAAGQDLRRGEDRAGAHQLLPQGQPHGAARAGAAAARVGPGGQGAGLSRPRRARAAGHSREGDGGDGLARQRAERCCASARASPGGWRPTGTRSTSRRRGKSRAASSPRITWRWPTTSGSRSSSARRS